VNNARRILSGQNKSDINNDKHNTLLTCIQMCLYLILSWRSYIFSLY